MRVLLVNSVCGIGSTGRICAQLAFALKERGDECKIAYGRSASVPKDCSEFAMRIGTKKDVAEHIAETRLFDNHGFPQKMPPKNGCAKFKILIPMLFIFIIYTAITSI